jgi:RHS repeat-associated protein
VYVDALILRDRDTDANGSLDERLWVVQDANFNVTALVNTSGTVVERYAYDPYGVATVMNASWVTLGGSAYSWVHLHQGGRFDSVSGLYDFRNRQYSPTLGRWVTIDPMGYSAGDVNLYGYVASGPISSLDPLGLQQPGLPLPSFTYPDPLTQKLFLDPIFPHGFIDPSGASGAFPAFTPPSLLARVHPWLVGQFSKYLRYINVLGKIRGAAIPVLMDYEKWAFDLASRMEKKYKGCFDSKLIDNWNGYLIGNAIQHIAISSMLNYRFINVDKGLAHEILETHEFIDNYYGGSLDSIIDRYHNGKGAQLVGLVYLAHRLANGDQPMILDIESFKSQIEALVDSVLSATCKRFQKLGINGDWRSGDFILDWKDPRISGLPGFNKRLPRQIKTSFFDKVITCFPDR